MAAVAVGALDPAELDPANPAWVTAVDLVFDRLTGYDTTTNAAVPNLASSWSTSDLVHWTFTLDPGRTFSDGAPVTASDVVTSLERVAADPTSLPGARLDVIDGVAGLAAGSTWVVGAKVGGSGRIYQTQVKLYLSRGEVLWTGECTCPMQVDCKHSVAVAIVARQTFGLAGAAAPATPAAYVSDSDLARWAVVPALDEPASWTDQPPPDEYDRYDYDDDGYPDPLAALHHLHPGAPTTPGLPAWERAVRAVVGLSLIHISEPTRLLSISYAVLRLQKKKKNKIYHLADT